MVGGRFEELDVGGELVRRFLTVVHWRDAATLRAWRELPRHREAQRRGRERWYEQYKIETAEVVREGRFERSSGGETSPG